MTENKVTIKNIKDRSATKRPIIPMLNISAKSVMPSENETNKKLKELGVQLKEEPIGCGVQGSVYSLLNSEGNNIDYVAKIIKNSNNATRDSVKGRINVAGGGFTKPLDSFKLGDGTVVEFYKKREKDRSKSQDYDENLESDYSKSQDYDENLESDYSKSQNDENYTEKQLKNCLTIAESTQILLSIKAACDNGVIPTDLKLDNMLITKKGITLSDITSYITTEEAENGTICVENQKYLPPDLKKTVKSPIFSFGAILFESYTGKDFINFLNNERKLSINSLTNNLAFLPKKFGEIIVENINPDIINLERIFPDVKKEKFKEKEEEIKNKYCEYLKGMLFIDPQKRNDADKMKEKSKELIEYLVDEVGLDVKTDLKLDEKILFRMEMYDRMENKNKYMREEENEIINNIKLLLSETEPKTKKEREHMATLFGIEKFSENGEIIPKKPELSQDAKNCLEKLRTFISNKDEEDISFKEDIKNLKKNEEEYLLVNKLVNDSKVIKKLYKETQKETVKSAQNLSEEKNKKLMVTPNSFIKKFEKLGSVPNTFVGKLKKSNSNSKASSTPGLPFKI